MYHKHTFPDKYTILKLKYLSRSSKFFQSPVKLSRMMFIVRYFTNRTHMYLGVMLLACTIVVVSVSVETEGQMSSPLLQGRQLDPLKFCCSALVCY